jgi:hypothetical protein
MSFCKAYCLLLRRPIIHSEKPYPETNIQFRLPTLIRNPTLPAFARNICHPRLAGVVSSPAETRSPPNIRALPHLGVSELTILNCQRDAKCYSDSDRQEQAFTCRAGTLSTQRNKSSRPIRAYMHSTRVTGQRKPLLTNQQSASDEGLVECMLQVLVHVMNGQKVRRHDTNLEIAWDLRSSTGGPKYIIESNVIEY